MDIIEKIKAVTLNEVSELSYFYDEHLIGLIGTAFAKAGVPRTNPIPIEYFNAFKEVVEEEMFSGIEPEWASMEAYNNWENLHTRYVYRTETEHGALKRWDGNRSPYKDKTIPYLCPK